MEIKVPALGESITEATVASWLKKQGEYVEMDEPIVELETDKITVEVNAPVSGTLKEILTAEDDVVEVGAIIGHIDESASAPIASAQNTEEKAVASPAKAAAPQPASTQSDEAILSPAARKHAAEHNLSPAAIPGTGKDGRITKQDVLTAAAKKPTDSTPHVSRETGPREERIRMTRLRQRIAQRLKDSQNTAALLTTFNEIDMQAVMDLRARHKDAFLKKHGVKLGFMSFFTKACVQALQEIPALNAEIDGQDVIYKNYFNIGVAVGTESGLVVPVVKDADTKSFASIEQEIAELGAKGRNDTLSINDMSGGTFTISNGGVYGSLLSTPIVNPPQSGILGLHKIEKRAVVVGDEIKIRPMMYVALTYDHRLIDGKEAVTFLVHLKKLIEDPSTLLLDL